jgi:hypothetical protein
MVAAPCSDRPGGEHLRNAAANALAAVAGNQSHELRCKERNQIQPRPPESGGFTPPSTQDKAGRLHFPLAAAPELPSPLPVPAPFLGSLLLTPPWVAIPAVIIPASGSIDYPAVFPRGSYGLQSLSLSTVPLGGSMTNVAR